MKEVEDPIPSARAQFFYASPLPIDDPLSALPPTTGDSKSVKYSPRPFSAYDNNALEEAWLGLCSRKDGNVNKDGREKTKKISPKGRESQAEKRASAINELANKHNKKHARDIFVGDYTAAKNGKKSAGNPKQGVT